MTEEPNDINSLSQDELIQQLQQSINLLSSLVAKLQTGKIEQFPNQTTVETLLTTTRQLSESLEMASQPPKTPLSEESIPKVIDNDENQWEEDEPQPLSPTEKTSLSTEPSSGLQRLWEGILTPFRAVLPTGLNEKLSNLALTGIVLGIVGAISVTIWVLYPQSTTEVVQAPSEPLKLPEVIETPPQLEAPDIPQPLILEPPPEPELTPEQSLIAAIQAEVSDITSRYPEGLISAIQPNFLESRLMITVGNTWYELRPQRQDDVAKGIFQRAQQLDFRKLELLDTEGRLIARSPVVGSNMIILQRQKSS